MKRRYKVLPLEFPFNCEKDWWEECVSLENQILPVFRRNGYFFDRQTGIAWLEINGEAYKYGTRESFQYTLDHNDGNNWMDPRLFQALGVLISFRMATPKQRHAYYVQHQRQVVKHIKREASLTRRAIIGR